MPRSYRDSRQRKAAMGRLASVRILRVVLPADPGLRPGGEAADVLAMADDHEDGDAPRHLGTLAVGQPPRVNRRAADRHQGGERRVAAHDPARHPSGAYKQADAPRQAQKGAERGSHTNRTTSARETRSQ